MISAPVQNQSIGGRSKTVVKAAWARAVSIWHLLVKTKGYFCGRGSWFWFPVGFVGACSTVASSIVFMGAIITGRQEGQIELTVFLYCSGVVVMLGPMVLMARILDSVRAWVDPNHNGAPAGE